MHGNERFQWRLVLAPQLGFEVTIPTTAGPMPIFFPMPAMEARGLVLMLATEVPEVQPLMRPEVLQWLARRNEDAAAADAEFLQNVGVQPQ